MLIGKKALDFSAKAVFIDEIKEIKLSNYQGKHVVLFFYPADFTFVCPTELHAFQSKISLFKEKNIELLGCSVDSVFSHFSWLNMEKEKGGIKGIEYGLISDLGGEIARKYEVLSDANEAYRGVFLIDKNQIVRASMINDMPLGRNIDEILRLIDALQHFEIYGNVCPANWTQSEESIETNIESVSNYLKSKF